MTVIEIVSKFLKENSFDGLYGSDCACELNDLAPCGEDISLCRPGFKVPCPGPKECCNYEDCKFHISKEKISQQT